VANAPFWFWWLVPVVSTAVVVAGVWLSRRDRRPADTEQSVQEYARFRAAFGETGRRERRERHERHERPDQHDDTRSGAR
jgi:hypothetical protein